MRHRGATVDSPQTLQKLLSQGALPSLSRVERCNSDISPSRESSGRRDFSLSETSLQELAELNGKMADRCRRSAEGVEFASVPDEELHRCWENWVSSFTCGICSEGQSPAEECERKCLGGGGDVPPKWPPVASCVKGRKAHLEPMPNQDCFSIAHFKNGYSMACCMDGHGPDGHRVATRTAETLPYFLINSLLFPYNTAGALLEAFEHAQKDVVEWSLKNGTDIQASGTTAVAVVWKGSKVWIANVGDSRCVIGSDFGRNIVFESSDQKPDVPAERARIETSGGEIRSKVCRAADGWVVHRIFVEGQDYPGLAMSRSLGDETVKGLGVIATPQIHEISVNLREQPFILLASDGVWEFIMSENVVSAVGRRIGGPGGPAEAVRWLKDEALSQWQIEEGEYCDDITAVLIPLAPLQAPRRCLCCPCRQRQSPAN